MTEAELDALQALTDTTTPGPWYAVGADDMHAMSIVAVATVPDVAGRWPAFDAAQLVAATLIQSPRYVDAEDGRWEENAAFIAAAREAVPKLIAEIRRLRSQL